MHHSIEIAHNRPWVSAKTPKMYVPCWKIKSSLHKAVKLTCVSAPDGKKSCLQSGKQLFIGLKVKHHAQQLHLLIVLFWCQIDENYFRAELYRWLPLCRRKTKTEHNEVVSLSSVSHFGKGCHCWFHWESLICPMGALPPARQIIHPLIRSICHVINCWFASKTGPISTTGQGKLNWLSISIIYLWQQLVLYQFTLIVR